MASATDRPFSDGPATPRRHAFAGSPDVGLIAGAGSSSNAKRRRQAAGSRWQVLHVDACEVGARRGRVTIRVGHLSRRPACFALHVDDGFADQVHESHWTLRSCTGRPCPRLRSGAASGDAEGTYAAIEAWLLEQDWRCLLAKVPADHDVFRLTLWGYAAIGARPPFTRAPLLAISGHGLLGAPPRPRPPTG